jgi:hypothetical protein
MYAWSPSRQHRQIFPDKRARCCQVCLKKIWQASGFGHACGIPTWYANSEMPEMQLHCACDMVDEIFSLSSNLEKFTRPVIIFLMAREWYSLICIHCSPSFKTCECESRMRIFTGTFISQRGTTRAQMRSRMCIPPCVPEYVTSTYVIRIVSFISRGILIRVSDKKLWGTF